MPRAVVGAPTTAKSYRVGTHRVRTPEETWGRIATQLRHFGITRMADLTRLDVLGIPVYQAVRPASRNLSVAQGKGSDPLAARVSAAMEAIELWHAEDLAHRVTRRDSLSRVSRDGGLDLALLPWRYDPAPLADWTPEWIELEALGAPPAGRARRAWVPRALLELDLSQPERFDLQPLRRSSNGLASGNCLEEAQLHGVCELVERDAVAQGRLGRRQRHPLDPGTANPVLSELLARIASADFEVAFYDLTGPPGIPVIQATLAGADLPEIWNGSGCHPSPQVAALRALTEAAQCRLTYIAGVRDDLLRPDDPGADPAAVDGWDLRQALREQRRREGEPVRRLEEIEDLATDSVADDLAAVLDRLARHGIHIWGSDLAKPAENAPWGDAVSVYRVVSTDLHEAFFG